MAAEFFDESRKYREGLREFANDLLYIHENNPIPDDSAEEFRENLMTGVMKVMDLEGDVQKYQTVYEQITAQLKSSEEELPTDEEMKAMWDKMEEEMGEVKGPNRKHFKDIVRTIRDEKEEEEEQEGEEGEKGEEMEVMQVQHSRKDPISKKDIVNPVINKACGHVYDRDSVTDFANRKRTIKCAMQGCSETITISKLVDYPDYWKNIKQQQQ